MENDRRALNVLHGMRRAKKEGRWMGPAPVGYANKITEDGKKFIAPKEPEARLIEVSILSANIEPLLERAFSNLAHPWINCTVTGIQNGSERSLVRFIPKNSLLTVFVIEPRALMKRLS